MTVVRVEDSADEDTWDDSSDPYEERDQMEEMKPQACVYSEMVQQVLTTMR